MKMTIDRIEGAIAVLITCEEQPQMMHVPFSLLPPGSREGDIVTVEIRPDEEATAAARVRVSSLIENLKKRRL